LCTYEIDFDSPSVIDRVETELLPYIIRSFFINQILFYEAYNIINMSCKCTSVLGV